MGGLQRDHSSGWRNKACSCLGADSAVKISLTQEEMAELEQLASDTGVDTKGSWENPMV